MDTDCCFAIVEKNNRCITNSEKKHIELMQWYSVARPFLYLSVKFSIEANTIQSPNHFIDTARLDIGSYSGMPCFSSCRFGVIAGKKFKALSNFTADIDNEIKDESGILRYVCRITYCDGSDIGYVHK